MVGIVLDVHAQVIRVIQNVVMVYVMKMNSVQKTVVVQKVKFLIAPMMIVVQNHG